MLTTLGSGEAGGRLGPSWAQLGNPEGRWRAAAMGPLWLPPRLLPLPLSAFPWLPDPLLDPRSSSCVVAWAGRAAMGPKWGARGGADGAPA
jgi:hypothetical protein